MSYQTNPSKLFETPLPQKVKKEKQKRSYSFILPLIFIAIIGFLAGIAGQLFSLDSIAPVEQSTIISEKRFVEKNVKEEENSSPILESGLEGYAVYFFDIMPDPKKSWYRDSGAIGKGVSLTSDGWLASASSVFKKTAKEEMIVQAAGRFYEVEELVKDDFSGLVYVKISAKGLPVIKFGRVEDLNVLDKLYVADSSFGITSYSVSLLNADLFELEEKEDAVLSSDRLSSYIFLFGSSSPKIGSGMINEHGELAGVVFSLVSNQIAVIPSNEVKRILEQVLISKKIIRPWFGVSYIDLSENKNPNHSMSSDFDRGVLIIRDEKFPQQSAVLKDSSAFGILREGDILLSIEGQELGKKYHLPEIIQQYKIGTKIKLIVVRDGKEKEVEMVLKPRLENGG